MDYFFRSILFLNKIKNNECSTLLKGNLYSMLKCLKINNVKYNLFNNNLTIYLTIIFNFKKNILV